MQLSIQIRSGSCNAQRAHPRPCTGADIIGSWGGSLDAHGLRAAPLKNCPCNSSDLLFWHRLFLITSSGISFSSRHSEGKGTLVLQMLSSCSIYACCLFSTLCFLFLFASVYLYIPLFATSALCKIKRYKQPGMQIIRSKSNIISISLVAWTLIKYAKRGSPTQGWCLTLGAVECYVLDDSKSVGLKWRAHQNQVRVAAQSIFRAFSHFILNSDLICLPLETRLRWVLHAFCQVWCVANEVKSPHWTKQLWRHWRPWR